MAVTRKEPRCDPIEAMRREHKERMDRPIIKTRWYVTEHMPDYIDHQYDDRYPGTNFRVSNYLDTEEQAKQWVDTHESDKGKLEIHMENLREFVERRWVSY